MVAPECAVTLIPPHLHHVRVGLTHYDLNAAYGLRDKLQLFIRLPYDIKAERVRYTSLDGAPYIPPYGDIHHRTETLRGVSDPAIGLEAAIAPDWIAGVGVTLPAGRTQADPVRLGMLGLRHEHIQFGSGTVRPTLSAQWRRPLGAQAWFARAEMRLSLYENDRGFRAPTEVTWSLGPAFRLRGVSIDPRLTGQRQTVARWSGVADEGTGFDSGGMRLQLSMPFRGTVVAPSVYRELWSHGAHGETFRQGTTWSLSLTRTF
jgi:hypothetical protein